MTRPAPPHCEGQLGAHERPARVADRAGVADRATITDAYASCSAGCLHG